MDVIDIMQPIGVIAALIAIYILFFMREAKEKIFGYYSQPGNNIIKLKINFVIQLIRCLVIFAGDKGDKIVYICVAAHLFILGVLSILYYRR